MFRVSGRNFRPGNEVALIIRGADILNQKVRVDERGRFATRIRLPEDLPYGMYTIEALLDSVRDRAPLTIAEFIKAHSDEDK